MVRGETVSVLPAQTSGFRVVSCEENLPSASEQDDMGDEEELWPDLAKRIESLFTQGVPGGEVFGQKMPVVPDDVGVDQMLARPAMRRPPQVRSPSASPSRPPRMKCDRPSSGLSSLSSSPPCPPDEVASLGLSHVPPVRSTTSSRFPGTPAFGGAAFDTLRLQQLRAPTVAGSDIQTPSKLSAFEVEVSPSLKDGNVSFRVGRLGVPCVPRESVVGPAEGEQAAREHGTDVTYIHIPRHALKGFQNFARGVASECKRDNAADNPYVRALCNHRAEMQNHSVIPSPSEAPSLEQQMASEREALSLMMPAELRAPSESLPMGRRLAGEGDAQGCAAGEAWLTAWPLCSESGVHGSPGQECAAGESKGDGCMLWRCGSAQEEAWSMQVDPVRVVEAAQPGYTAICSGYTPRRDARPGFPAAGSSLRSVPRKPHSWQRNAQSPLSPRVLFPVEQEEGSLDGLL